jgi:enoyl-CoA hydratase/carnithine racemase
MDAFEAPHFSWNFEAGLGTITLNRPERKKSLTFDSYGELRNLFDTLKYATDIKVVVVNL